MKSIVINIVRTVLFLVYIISVISIDIALIKYFDYSYYYIGIIENIIIGTISIIVPIIGFFTIPVVFTGIVLLIKGGLKK